MLNKTIKISTIILSLLCLCFALFTGVFASTRQSTQVSTNVTYKPGLLFQVYGSINDGTEMLIFDNYNPNPVLDYSYFSPTTPPNSFTSHDTLKIRTVNKTSDKTIRTKVTLENKSPTPVYIDEAVVASPRIEPFADEYTNQFHIVSMFKNAVANLVINVYEVNLTDDYSELEYIESTGTQYINTNYFSNVTTDAIEIQFEMTQNSIQRTMIAGWQTSGPGGAEAYHEWWYNYAFGSNVFAVNVRENNTSNHINCYGPCDNKIHTIKRDKLNVYNEESLVGTLTNFSYAQATIPFGLFGRIMNTNGTSADLRATAKIYFAKIWDNGSLVRNYIPAMRNSDGAIGLYDSVSGTFFENDGSGEFLAGPNLEIPSDYTLLEYIESTGTQYIDTDIPLLDSVDFEIIGNFTNTYHGGNMGALAASGSNHWAIMCGYSVKNQGFNYGWGIASSRSTSSCDLDTHNWNKKGMSYYIDDTLIATCSPTSNTRTAWLFDVNGWNNCECYFKMNSCKMWENGTLARNFVPVLRDSDGEIGLYDTVTDTLAYNQGTGKFIAGPLLNK